jgi:hypothetical protein
MEVDQKQVMALVAPRGLMMYAAYSEHEGNAFGYEQAYRSVRKVYRFLGREENVQLHLRIGGTILFPTKPKNLLHSSIRSLGDTISPILKPGSTATRSRAG